MSYGPLNTLIKPFYRLDGGIETCYKYGVTMTLGLGTEGHRAVECGPPGLRGSSISHTHLLEN